MFVSDDKMGRPKQKVKEENAVRSAPTRVILAWRNVGASYFRLPCGFSLTSAHPRPILRGRGDTMKDMTAAQFGASLKRHGMTPQGFMGYVDVGIPNHRLHISGWNGGERRRDQLAYLLKQRDLAVAKCESGKCYACGENDKNALLVAVQKG
jgi:hypothetical protein